MSKQTHFACLTTEGDYLEVEGNTDGSVNVAVADSNDYVNDHAAMMTLARSDIPKLITTLQIIYEQGKN